MNILRILTPKREVGTIGERAATRYLRRHGCRVIAKNYVAFDKEIDIIAKERDTLVFVEVKTRTKGSFNPLEPRPASAVTREKQRKIIAAAKCFVGMNGYSLRMRFDVIEVFLDERKKVLEVKHLKSAFNQDTARRRM